MAKYILGDIHGDLDRWNVMKEKIKLTKDDKLVIIGDVIDRGNSGVTILREIINTPNMHLILGNHELMMIENFALDPNDTSENASNVRENWMFNGGYPTVEAMANLSDDEQNKIIEYLKTNTRLRAKVKTDDGRLFCVAHGWLNNINDDNIHNVVWNRPERTSRPNLDMMLIIGHTPVVNLYTDQELIDTYNSHARILHAPHFINIDCGCGHEHDKRSCLACLRIDDMAEFYV